MRDGDRPEASVEGVRPCYAHGARLIVRALARERLDDIADPVRQLGQAHLARRGDPMSATTGIRRMSGNSIFPVQYPDLRP